MTNARLFFPIALLLVVGCAGTSSVPASHASVVSTPAQGANVSVRFLWPAKNVTATGRQASYISPATDHIRVATLYGYSYNSLAASDQSVVIPFGTPSATIPAIVGYNYWNFSEYDSPQETLLLASSYASLYIYDPSVAYTLDIVLQMNSAAMGVAVNAVGTSVSSSSGMTPGVSGSIKLNAFYATNGANFVVYLTPTDSHKNVATGPGVPGVSISTTDARLALARTASTTTGPYAGQVAYSLTLVGGPLLSTDPAIVLNVYSIGTSSGNQYIGAIRLTSNPT